MLYTDDTLNFSGDTEVQLDHLSLILVVIEALPELSISLAKSHLLSVNDVQNVQELAKLLGCSVGSYLGYLLDTRKHCFSLRQ